MTEKIMENYAKQFLGKKVTVKVDRMMGSKHPDKAFYYPINYGYIEGVLAPDGEDVDAYILGVFKPIKEYTGKCIAVIHRLDDEDDKLVVVPNDADYSDEQIIALTEFQERFHKSEIIR